MITTYFAGTSSQLKLNGITPSKLQATDFILNTVNFAQTIDGNDYYGDQLFGGLGNDTLRGFRGNDALFGEQGNDRLEGGSGNDTLYGGDGNDTYSFLANTPLETDTITETTTGGTDTINFSGTTVPVNVNLSVTSPQTVNSNLNLILSANNVIENATGGTGNDRLTGNTVNNTLIGGDGNDQLQGLVGNDTLQGGNGDDLLWGGLGDDIFTGGAGKDKYIFQNNEVFSKSLGVDYITDFEVGQDQIVLSKTTFNAVTNTVGQAFTDFAVVTDDKFVNANNAHIIFSQSSGSLFYNQDGKILGTATVFEFARLGNPNITLSNSSFSLIA